MYIYKFTHIETGRTWKLTNGTRVWFDKEASV